MSSLKSLRDHSREGVSLASRLHLVPDSRSQGSSDSRRLTWSSGEAEQFVVFETILILFIGLRLSRGGERSVGRGFLEDDPLDEELNDAFETTIRLLG